MNMNSKEKESDQSLVWEDPKKLTYIANRFDEVFKGFLIPLVKYYRLAEYVEARDKTRLGTNQYPIFRIKHKPIGKHQISHSIAFICYSLSGYSGLRRSDNKPIVFEEVTEDGNDWYKIECPVSGCKGTVSVSVKGIPVIKGRLQMHTKTGWNTCNEVKGCVIL